MTNHIIDAISHNVLSSPAVVRQAESLYQSGAVNLVHSSIDVDGVRFISAGSSSNVTNSSISSRLIRRFSAGVQNLAVSFFVIASNGNRNIAWISNALTQEVIMNSSESVNFITRDNACTGFVIRAGSSSISLLHVIPGPNARSLNSLLVADFPTDFSSGTILHLELRISRNDETGVHSVTFYVNGALAFDGNVDTRRIESVFPADNYDTFGFGHVGSNHVGDIVIYDADQLQFPRGAMRVNVVNPLNAPSLSATPQNLENGVTIGKADFSEFDLPAIDPGVGRKFVGAHVYSQVTSATAGEISGAADVQIRDLQGNILAAQASQQVPSGTTLRNQFSANLPAGVNPTGLVLRAKTGS